MLIAYVCIISHVSILSNVECHQNILLVFIVSVVFSESIPVLYNGTNLIVGSVEPVVVVTFNYRLSALASMYEVNAYYRLCADVCFVNN